MLSTFNRKTITQASVLVPVLLKSVEKAVSQPTVALSVTEGLCAALMLLKFSSLPQDKDNNVQIMWNAVLDMDKQIFVSEKYLSTCNEDSKLPFKYLNFT